MLKEVRKAGGGLLEETIRVGGGQLEETRKAGKGQNNSRRKSCVAIVAIQCQFALEQQTALWWNWTKRSRLTWFHETTSEVRKNGGWSIEQDEDEEDEADKKRRKADECRKEKMMSDEDEGEASKVKGEEREEGRGGNIGGKDI